MKQDATASPPAAIADALVFGIAYLTLDEEDIERTDEDRATVDEIYDMLSERSALEQDVLLAATRRACAAESADAFLGKSYRSIFKRYEGYSAGASATSSQENLAAALVYVIAYLSVDDKGDNRADDDGKALESIFDILSRSTFAEQDSLISATRQVIASVPGDAYVYQQVLEDLEELFAGVSGD